LGDLEGFPGYEAAAQPQKIWEANSEKQGFPQIERRSRRWQRETYGKEAESVNEESLQFALLDTSKLK